MKENLRIFHEDQVSSRFFCLFTGLQKGKHVNTPHALSHAVDTSDAILIIPADFRCNRKHLLHIPVHRITDCLFPSVFTEICIDTLDVYKRQLGDKVLYGVMRKEFLEFTVELRGKCLIVGDNNRWFI